MTWVAATLLAIAAVFFVLGYIAVRRPTATDGIVGSFFYLGGFAALALLVVVAIGGAVVRALFQLG